MYILKLEFEHDIKSLFIYWNHSVHRWLKYYVYLRITPTGKKPGFKEGIATFFASAVWHGFYLSYINFFCLLFVFQTLDELVRPYFKRLTFIPAIVGHVIAW